MTNGSEYTTLATAGGDAQVIADLADIAASHAPIEVIDGRMQVYVLNAGQRIEKVDLDDYAARPERKTGTVLLTEAESFVEYVARHKTADGLTLWASIDKSTITAVFDDHVRDDDLAGWGEHRAVLTLRKTLDWTHWRSQDGQLLGQVEFAEHLEEGINAVRDPAAATMMEIAQSISAKKDVEFKSDQRLNNGCVQLQFEETIAARAGHRGDLQIPEIITLGLPPFEGNDPYEVKARFRYRLHNGALKMGYRLVRPDIVLRAAFADVLVQIADGTGHPVLRGVPR